MCKDIVEQCRRPEVTRDLPALALCHWLEVTRCARDDVVLWRERPHITYAIQQATGLISA